MSDKQKTALISIALSAIVAVLAVFGYNVVVVQPEVAALNAQIDQLQQPPEEPAGAVGDTNLTNLVLSGDLTVGDDAAVTGDMAITGGLSVTGGVTGTNVLVTGNQTIAGIKTFSTAIAVGAVTGPVTLTGPTAVATATPAAVVNNLGAANVSFEVRDSATPVFQVLNGGSVAAGAIYGKAPLVTKDASYAVTAADTGSVIKASGAITLTLPGAAAGLSYCIVNFTGDDQVIDFTDSADVALNEVNSPGDRVTNTTVYDNICLTAIDATNWSTISSVGTWADGN